MPRAWFGAIAQLGERVLCKHEVVGSIPSGSTILRRAGGAMQDALRSLGEGGPQPRDRGTQDSAPGSREPGQRFDIVKEGSARRAPRV